MKASEAREQSAKHFDYDKYMDEYTNVHIEGAIKNGKYVAVISPEGMPDGEDWRTFADNCRNACHRLGYKVIELEHPMRITQFKINWEG